MIFSFSRIRIVESSLNDSTQSPAWSRNARPSSDVREALPERTGLAGEDERRARAQPFDRRGCARRVGPLRLLERRALAPRLRTTRSLG